VLVFLQMLWFSTDSFFLPFFTMFLVFSLFLFLLHSKKLHPMQFPQISGLSFVFYVNTIEKLENPYFYH